MFFYNHINIEKKWQLFWKKDYNFMYKKNITKEKYYILEMFLYPSGEIHIGHVRNYSLGDAYLRYKKISGYNILHPIGWDAFGLPAEKAAIKYNLHPQNWTCSNITIMKKQLLSTGLIYDWFQEINTSNIKYYKYQQQIFIDFFISDLIYKHSGVVNWDPVDKTVLSNEQVINGRGWRSNALIKRVFFNQWFFKIDLFVKNIIRNIKNENLWPNKVKIMQKNWIKKKIRILIKLRIHNFSIVNIIRINYFYAFFIKNYVILFFSSNIMHYYNIKYNIFKKKLFFQQEYKIIFTGLFFFHFTLKKRIPVMLNCNQNYICTHDIINTIFCIKLFLYYAPNINIFFYFIKKNKNNLKFILFNFFIIKKSMLRVTFYTIQNWGISRQRYWGCLIPILYCIKCGIIPVKKIDLPITSPLNSFYKKKTNPSFHFLKLRYAKCYICKKISIREIETLDTFFESSWYFLRFCNNKDMTPFKKEKILPVNQYIGGVEHAIMHLIYTKFFIQALNKIYNIHFIPPFKSLITQGMVCYYTFKDCNKINISPDKIIKKSNIFFIRNTKIRVKKYKYEKMSKSKNNVIKPKHIVAKYGADTIRLFLLSNSISKNNIEWSGQNVEKCYKYINNIYILIKKMCSIIDNKMPLKMNLTITNKYIENLLFSKYFMSVNNNIDQNKLPILQLLYPIIPHVVQELWFLIKKNNITNYFWNFQNSQSINKYYIIQINNKAKIKINFLAKNKIVVIRIIQNVLKNYNIINSIFFSKKKIVNIKIS